MPNFIYFEFWLLYIFFRRLIHRMILCKTQMQRRRNSNFSEFEERDWNLSTLAHFEGIQRFITLAKFNDSYAHQFVNLQIILIELDKKAQNSRALKCSITKHYYITTHFLNLNWWNVRQLIQLRNHSLTFKLRWLIWTHKNIFYFILWSEILFNWNELCL